MAHLFFSYDAYICIHSYAQAQKIFIQILFLQNWQVARSASPV